LDDADWTCTDSEIRTDQEEAAMLSKAAAGYYHRSPESFNQGVLALERDSGFEK